MASDWVDVCIPAELDAGELLGMLDDPAVQGAWEDAGTIHLYWPGDQWNGDRLASVRSVLSRMSRASEAESSLSVNRLPAQDWNQQWAQSVKPLRIGRRLVIRPSWEPVVLQPDEIEIILDPKQAFGTGHHATTRMLLEWLQDDIRGGEVVLDVGAGSGILAMAALRLGAVSAVGVECDPVAVECARDYASQNGFGQELELVCGMLSDLVERVRPDLVLANLDRQTLLALADDLAAYGTAGARLLCSGLLVDQEAEVAARYSKFGLYPTNRREQDGWVALELACPESCEGRD
jgi:ribosomal protein L11 methyltransferase